MSIEGIGAIIGTVITSSAVIELIKWLMTKKSNQRMAQAQAKDKEIEVRTDEYHLLRERLDVSDKQLIDKDKQYYEQTLLVRKLNEQLLDKTIENGSLQAEISGLKAERAMKLCERKGCDKRIPQSGY